MSYINPAFDNFPNEEAIIGRMILAFGELEYLMVTIAGTVNGDLAAIMKALYRLRSTFRGFVRDLCRQITRGRAGELQRSRERHFPHGTNPA